MKINLNLLQLRFVVLGIFMCSLISCAKDIETTTQLQNEALEIRDNVIYPNEYYYYIDKLPVTEAAYLTVSNNEKYFGLTRAVEDSVNAKNIVQNHIFTTKQKYLNYTDGDLGMNEQAEFAKDDQLTNYLTSEGFTNFDNMVLTPAQESAVENIMGVVSILALETVIFEHPWYAGNNAWIPGYQPNFWGLNNKVSSFKTKRSSNFRVNSTFYQGLYFTKRKHKFVIEKGSGDFGIPHFGQIGSNWLNDGSKSYRKIF